MSIKSDKWIKEMAESHKMIEPYQAGQVRKGENDERLYLQRCKASAFKSFE